MSIWVKTDRCPSRFGPPSADLGPPKPTQRNITSPT